MTLMRMKLVVGRSYCNQSSKMFNIGNQYIKGNGREENECTDQFKEYGNLTIDSIINKPLHLVVQHVLLTWPG